MDWKGCCHRCGLESRGYIMSMFDTALLCDICKGKERAHSSYKAACKAELKAISAGDCNFNGLGCPKDLL